jgi:hypothetical protein
MLLSKIRRVLLRWFGQTQTPGILILAVVFPFCPFVESVAGAVCLLFDSFPLNLSLFLFHFLGRKRGRVSIYVCGGMMCSKRQPMISIALFSPLRVSPSSPSLVFPTCPSKIEVFVEFLSLLLLSAHKFPLNFSVSCGHLVYVLDNALFILTPTFDAPVG